MGSRGVGEGYASSLGAYHHSGHHDVTWRPLNPSYGLFPPQGKTTKPTVVVMSIIM